MERESFIFYRSFYEAIHDLKDDIKLEVFTAITEYALYGKVPEDLKPVARGMFTLIRPNLDVNIVRYENGRKGGRKAKKQPASAVPDPAPPASGPTPPYSSFEEEASQLKSEQLWCESTSMQFHIDLDELHRRLDAFVIHCRTDRADELHPSIKDARRHFTSWMRKAYPMTENNDKQQSKPGDYTYCGGFGGLDQ